MRIHIALNVRNLKAAEALTGHSSVRRHIAANRGMCSS